MFHSFLRPGQGFQKFTVLSRQGGASVKPGDMLELMDRKFYVLGTHNPAGLGHFCIYFAQERKDLS